MPIEEILEKIAYVAQQGTLSEVEQIVFVQGAIVALCLTNQYTKEEVKSAFDKLIPTIEV